MAKNLDVYVRLQLRSARRFQVAATTSAKAVDSIGAAATGADASASGAVRGFIGLQHALTAVMFAAKLAAGAFAALGALVTVTGINFNRSMETSLTSFRLFLGSQEQALEFYDQLFEINKKTPFETAGINSAAAKLLGFKFTGEETIDIIRTIGDAIAGVGGGEESINALARAFGKMRAQAKLTIENLEPFTVRGIDVFGILREHLGGSQEELFDAISSGALKSEELIPVILAGISKDFKGAAEEQAKTFDGLLSTLKDTAAQTFGVVTMPLFEFVKNKVFKPLIGFFEALQVVVEEGGSAFDFTLGKLDDFLGGSGKLISTVELIIDSVSNLWEFITGSLAPALGNVGFIVGGVVLTGFKLLNETLKFLNDHTKTASVLIYGAITALTIYNGVVLIAWTRTKALALWTGILNVRMKLAKLASIGMTIAIIALYVAEFIATAASWALNIALLANPIVLLVIAIIAAIAGIVYVIIRFRKQILGAFKLIYNWLKDNWPLLLAILTGPIGLAVLFIIKYRDEIMDVIGRAITWITEKFDELVGFFSGLPGRMTDAISGIWDSLRDGFKSAINSIIRWWNDLELKLNVPFGPDVTIGTPNIPQLQYGGNIIRSGVALVGEQGPEIVHLPAGARVSPLLSGEQSDEMHIVTSPIEVRLDGRIVAKAIDRRVGSVRARA